MKKLLLFALLTSSLFAEAKIYMGLGYSLYNEEYTKSASNVASATDNAIKIKVGYGIREAYAVEFSVDYIEHASVDESPQAGKAKYGFNVALMKAFDWGIYVNPYMKAGFGAGYMDATDSLAYGSFDLGAGLFIPINSSFDVELGYEYKHLSYEKVQNQALAEKNESNVNAGYIGLNVRF